MTDKQIDPGMLRSLWQKMPTDPVIISGEEMRAKAKAFERRIWLPECVLQVDGDQELALGALLDELLEVLERHLFRAARSEGFIELQCDLRERRGCGQQAGRERSQEFRKHQIQFPHHGPLEKKWDEKQPMQTSLGSDPQKM